MYDLSGFRSGMPQRKPGIFSPFKRSAAKKDKKSQERLAERRPLHTVALAPPTYTVNPELLLNDYVEKEAKFLGSLSGVSGCLDPSSRTEILKLLDAARRVHSLPHQPGPEHDAVLSLSAYNLRLSGRDSEELLARIHIHDIAALSYVCDDAQHLIVIKTGHGAGEAMDQMSLRTQRSRSSSQLDATGCPPSEHNCNLVVMAVDSKHAAEELCALIGQVFQVVYTESTIDFLERVICDVASTPTKHSSLHSSTFTYSSKDVKPAVDPDSSLASFSQDTCCDASQASDKTHRRSQSKTLSESNLSLVCKDQLQEYMSTLQTKLSSLEIQEFAQLLHAYRTGASIQDFCQNLRQLYGESRKFLLLGMRDFIPEKDSHHFESFLETISIKDGRGIITDSFGRCKRTSAGGPALPRNGADDSTEGAPFQDPNEFDRIMSRISSELEALGCSADPEPS
ncbi:cerebral cavernous malformations 2 protein-like isoform X1 [Petromyzon marinus]|uniref:Cerebral cavernous malformations 2 protein-like isoform X1 n=1 Tax=Petromyzon marinus TaxID=7757 RepID=A0AAJ7XJQ3_PETMA|nr:cerebral cavernous malformations 2 protein-like isoform X1 [Petromyzon marinus]